MKLHHVFYKVDKEFNYKIQNHERTIWLFSNNNDMRMKNVDKFVKQISSQLQGSTAGMTQTRIKAERIGMPICCILIQNITRAK